MATEKELLININSTIMNFRLIILLSIILNSCSSLHYRKDNFKLLTCVVSQTSTSCDVYTVDVFNDQSLKVTFGEKEYNGNNYVQILEEKSIVLSKVDFKKIKKLKNQIASLKEFETKCMEKGGWQTDIYIDEKKFNFCNGEQLATPLGDLYQEIKQLSPIPFDLHWGGCPN